MSGHMRRDFIGVLATVALLCLPAALPRAQEIETWTRPGGYERTGEITIPEGLRKRLEAQPRMEAPRESIPLPAPLSLAEQLELELRGTPPAVPREPPPTLAEPSPPPVPPALVPSPQEQRELEQATSQPPGKPEVEVPEPPPATVPEPTPAQAEIEEQPSAPPADDEYENAYDELRRDIERQLRHEEAKRLRSGSATRAREFLEREDIPLPPDDMTRERTSSGDLGRMMELIGEATRTRDDDDDDETGLTPAPERPEDPEDPVPGPPGIPTIPPELAAQPPCCGLHEGFLYYPRTTDWLEPAEKQEARQDPAIAAHQAFLHDGGFFHNRSDLVVASVGMPFRLTHHYRSNLVQTSQGGIIGHKWDFNLNKRIVPIANVVTAQGLFAEQIGRDTPRLMYFDGHGRRDSYPGASTDVRTVRNFGTEFRAMVTTYRSPAGAFHEIQRYVLLEGSEHPFSHPNIGPHERIFYVLRQKNGLLYIFNCRGQMIFVIDRHDNRMVLVYAGPWNPLTQNPMLSAVFDTAGRKYSVESIDIDRGQVFTNFECRLISGVYPIPRIKSITEEATGRRVVFNYRRFDQEPVLVGVRQEFGNIHLVHRYTYAPGDGYLLETVTAPREAMNGGPPYLRNRYEAGKVVEQHFGPGTVRIAYRGSGATVTDANGNARAFEIEETPGGPVIARVALAEAGGNNKSWVHAFEHNADAQLTRMRFPKGNELVFEYEAANRPVTLGPVRNWVERDLTYANNLARGNLRAVRRLSNDPSDPYDAVEHAWEYEALFNQIERARGPRGNVTTFVYDYDKGKGYLGNAKEARLPTLTRPRGAPLTGLTRTYEYLDNGLLAAAVDTAGRRATYAYQERTGYLTAIGYPEGNRRFEVDGRGNVIRETSPLGTVTTYEYDLRDFLQVMVRDADGFANRVTFRYDRNGNQIGRKVEHKDNFHPGLGAPEPDPVSDTDIVYETVYDILNRSTVATISGEDGPGLRTVTEYDGNGNAVTITAPSPAGEGTSLTRLAYDGRDLVTSVMEAAGTPAASETRFSYDANGNLIEVLSPGARRTSFDIDGFDRRRARAVPTGGTFAFERDPAGNITRLTFTGDDGHGRRRELMKVSYAFDELGHLVRRAEALLDGTGGETEQLWLYAEGLQVAKAIGPGRGETVYTYDGSGRLVETVGPEGNAVVSTYDADGNRTAVVRRSRALEYVRRDGSWTETTSTLSWTFGYDALGRLVRQDGPGRSTGHFYDSLGHIRGTVDEARRLTEFQYDGLGRLAEVKASGRSETYRYSAVGLVTGVTSPLRDQAWTYDALGRVLVHEDRRRNATTTVQYDDAGNPIETRDPNGTVIRRSFNAANQVTRESITYPRMAVRLGSDVIPTLIGPTRVHYRYDDLGRLVFAENDRGRGTRVEREYDGLGRVILDAQTFQGDTQSVAVGYEADLSARRVTYPAVAGGFTIEERFDALGRISEILAAGDRLASYRYGGRTSAAARYYGNLTHTIYGFDNRRRLDRILVEYGTAGVNTRDILYAARATYAGGLPSNIEQSLFGRDAPDVVIKTSMERDSRGRAIRTTTSRASPMFRDEPPASTTSTVLHEYDRIGRAKRTVEYLRNDLTPANRSSGRIVHLRANRFIYGADGRITATESRATNEVGGPVLNPDIDAAARLAENGPFADRQEFLHDRNGNLITDDRYVYAYDHKNRLTRIYDRWQPYRYHEAATFFYDPLGRRVSMAQRQPPAGGLVQWGPRYRPSLRFIYDGLHAIAEIQRGHPDHPGPSLLARYIYGARGNELIRMDRRRDESPDGHLDTYYLHEGIGGTIRLLTDADGDPVRASFRDPPGRSRPGAAGSPPGDRHLIAGTETRSPFLNSTTRIDGFAGTRFDQQFGRHSFDYSRAPDLDRAMSTAAYRESITVAMNRGAVVLAALTAAPFAPYILTSLPALGWSALGLAMDYGTAVYTQSSFSAGQAAVQFVIGAVGGRVGQALSAVGLRPALTMGAGYAADVGIGTFIDVAYYDRRFAESLSDNMVSAALFTAVGAGAGAGVGVVLPAVATKAWKLAADTATPSRQRIGDEALGGRAAPHGSGTSSGELKARHCSLCFAAGTRVQTEKGWKRIEKVRTGDKVWSRDEATGRFAWKRVSRTFVTHPKTFARLLYRARESHRHKPVLVRAGAAGHGSGTGDNSQDPDEEDPDEPPAYEVVGTPTHPVRSLSRNGWVHLGALLPGEAIALADGEAAEVVEVVHRRAPEGTSFTAYNFSVEDFASYFVAPRGTSRDAPAIWVHNTSGGLGGCGPGSGNPADMDFVAAETLAKKINDAALRYIHDRQPGTLPIESAIDYLARNEIYLYRGIPKPGGRIDPGTYAYRRWWNAQNDGRAVPPGERKPGANVNQNTLIAHIEGLAPLSLATSWTTHLDTALRFGGNLDAVLLRVEVSKVFGRVLNYPKGRHREAEILLHSGEMNGSYLRGQIIKRPGARWSPGLLR